MVGVDFLALGLGRFVRVDRVLAVEPITGDERGPGNRTRVWVEGMDRPLVASRSESALLADMTAMRRGELGEGAEVSSGPETRDEVDPPPSLF